MKTATILLASLFALATAAPTNDKPYAASESKDHQSHKGKSSQSYSQHPFSFTSTIQAWATPDQIINNNQTSVPGLPGGNGLYLFGINSIEDVICYNITLYGFGDNPAYSSPAKTATHIHEAVKGRAGPPRLAFPNPQPDADYNLRSVGCLSGPFTTGILANGQDTGTGFTIKQLEANPSGFFADVHTTQYLAGAVRGQLYTD